MGPPTKWTEWWNLLEFDGYRWCKTGQCGNLWYSEVQIKEQKWDSSHLTESKTKQSLNFLRHSFYLDLVDIK